MAVLQLHSGAVASFVVAFSLLTPCAANGQRRELPVIRDPIEKAPTGPALSEAEEQSVAGDPYATVVGLNDVVFGGNVLQEGDDATSTSWVVYFCPTWYDPCRNLLKPFASQSAEWQARLNDGLFMNQVRFARVDCASHKPLCNQEGVENYPTVTHYQRGRPVAKWSANGRNDDNRLIKWLAQQLVQVPAASSIPSKVDEVRLAIASGMPASERLVDFAVILSVIGLSLYTVCRNPQLVAKTGMAPSLHVPATVVPSAVAELAGAVQSIIPKEWASRGHDSLEL